MMVEEFNQLQADKQQRFWELYVSEVTQSKIKPSLRDFIIWLKERDG